MSNNEFNYGRITPVDLTQEDIVEMCIAHNNGSQMPAWCDTWDEYWDENSYGIGFVKLNQKWYQLSGHRCTKDYDGKLVINNDGSIDFLTYHYNGGAFWTEVLEQKLKEI
jgi:hypothetical protein